MLEKAATQQQKADEALLEAVQELTEQVKRLQEGFPDGDADGHRRYHLEVMEMMADRRKLRQELISHLVKSGTWAALVGAAVVLWHYVTKGANP